MPKNEKMNQDESPRHAWISEIFPNPFYDYLHIPKVLSNHHFVFLNTLGVVVFEGQNLESTNLTHLPTGIYHLNFADFPKLNFVICKK